MYEIEYRRKGNGLSALGETSQFEKLNNMIVRAALKTPAFAQLNDGWQDEVVEERNWKIAIPPLWASLLQDYWNRYAVLYAGAPPALQATLINPATGQPGGTAEAYAELIQPTRDTAAAAAAAAEAAWEAAVAAAKKKAAALVAQARAAAAEEAKRLGKAAAKGSEEVGSPARTGFIAAGLLGLAAVLWWNRQASRR